MTTNTNNANSIATGRVPVDPQVLAAFDGNKVLTAKGVSNVSGLGVGYCQKQLTLGVRRGLLDSNADSGIRCYSLNDEPQTEGCDSLDDSLYTHTETEHETMSTNTNSNANNASVYNVDTDTVNGDAFKAITRALISNRNSAQVVAKGLRGLLASGDTNTLAAVVEAHLNRSDVDKPEVKRVRANLSNLSKWAVENDLLTEGFKFTPVLDDDGETYRLAKVYKAPKAEQGAIAKLGKAVEKAAEEDAHATLAALIAAADELRKHIGEGE